jgi:T5orf172 domain
MIGALPHRTLDMSNAPFAATNSWCYHFSRYEVLPEILASPEVASGQPFRLVEMVKRVMNRHLSQDQQDTKYARRDSGEEISVAATIKWYVPFVARNTRQLIRVGEGMFRLPSVDDVTDDAEDAQEAEAVLSRGSAQDEVEVGDFDGSIYAFTFPPLERETERFPIKVGMTVGDVEARVFGQCRNSAAFDRPKILGQWRVKRVNAVESAVHQVLKARGRWREHAPGIEWFDTRTEEVEAILRFVTEG